MKKRTKIDTANLILILDMKPLWYPNRPQPSETSAGRSRIGQSHRRAEKSALAIFAHFMLTASSPRLPIFTTAKRAGVKAQNLTYNLSRHPPWYPNRPQPSETPSGCSRIGQSRVRATVKKTASSDNILLKEQHISRQRRLSRARDVTQAYPRPSSTFSIGHPPFATRPTPRRRPNVHPASATFKELYLLNDFEFGDEIHMTATSGCHLTVTNVLSVQPSRFWI